MGLTKRRLNAPEVESTYKSGKPLSVLRQLITRADLVFLLAAFPLLMFPVGYLPWGGLALGVSGGLLRRYRTGTWVVKNHLNLPMLVMLLMTLVSLYPSVSSDLSMPKFYGILAGLFILDSTIGNVKTQRHFWLGFLLLVISLAGVLLVSMLGTQWNGFKAPFFQQIYGYLPRVISSVQTSIGVTPGFHANEVGGTVAFLLPVPVALLVGAPLRRLHKIMLGGLALLSFAVLVLTASRSALMALAVVIWLLILWRWRLMGFALLLTVAVGLGAAILLNAQGVAEFMLKADLPTNPALGTFVYRTEIWERAFYMVQDFPFTGIGLNTFSVILDTLYPSFNAGLEADLPHAHNIFLQTAVDLGLGGLAGFLALWASVAYVGWRAYRQAAAGGTSGLLIKAAIVGILLGLLSYLIYGLTDAITLGAKPTPMLWLMVGLLASIQSITLASTGSVRQSGTASSASGRLQFTLIIARNLYWCVAFGLVVLAYVAIAIAARGWSA